MRWVAAICLVLSACGHERAALVSAKVTRAEGGTQIPVKGASGTLTCPNTLEQELGTSDQEGLMRAQHIGPVPLECTVSIALSGYQPFTARIVDVCKEPVPRACANADLTVALAAASQGGRSNAGK